MRCLKNSIDEVILVLWIFPVLLIAQEDEQEEEFTDYNPYIYEIIAPRIVENAVGNVRTPFNFVSDVLVTPEDYLWRHPLLHIQSPLLATVEPIPGRTNTIFFKKNLQASHLQA